MAKRIQDFRNFDPSKEVTTSKPKKAEVVTKSKKEKKINKQKTITKTKAKEYKEESNNKTSKIIITFFVLLIITGITIGCLFSPTFNLTGIIVNDGINVTSEEILKSFDVAMETNIFKIDYKNIKNSIKEKLPYIRTVDVKLELPSEIKIEYEERKPFALLKYLESYMVMDKYGYILEITRENKFPELPIMYNIRFDSYEIGKQLDDTAKTKFDNVVYLLESAKQSEFKYTIYEINYESISNVKIWVKEENIEIIYGEIDRNMIEDKLNSIEEILNYTKGKNGKIDISNSDYSEGKTVFTERL